MNILKIVLSLLSLFKKNLQVKTNLSNIKLHIAGATVRHNSPFNNLESYSNNVELTDEVISKWSPLWGIIPPPYSEAVQEFKDLKPRITKEIVLALLGDFNFRSRIVGAYFASIKDFNDLIDIIGIHLLKSEVAYAGQIYCLVLAAFNNPQSIEYLNKYLNYYLTKLDLYFDQRYAMEAALYLDEINGTDNFEKHRTAWLEFVKGKQFWEEEISIDNFKKDIEILTEIKEYQL